MQIIEDIKRNQQIACKEENKIFQHINDRRRESKLKSKAKKLLVIMKKMLQDLQCKICVCRGSTEIYWVSLKRYC